MTKHIKNIIRIVDHTLDRIINLPNFNSTVSYIDMCIVYRLRRFNKLIQKVAKTSHFQILVNNNML